MPTLLFAVGEVIMLDICLHRRRILEIALGRSRFLPRSVLFPLSLLSRPFHVIGVTIFFWQTWECQGICAKSAGES